ncbi:MAG TPA: Sir2 family NAD-dependent protein deacetylase [Blastocatellia bacterium]|nr:Sir2 family NAD-dependent protein deacetylase [Blastocatellia bacterium]
MTFEEAAKLITASRRVVGFTGAGISTESGIPDFRSPNGVWATNRIIEYQEFVSSRPGRVEYWRQKVAMWPEMRDAQPNAGHLAFAELERRGQLRAMITQNIDGLHQRAGVKDVIELHGTTVDAVCLTCGDRISMDEAVRRVEEGDSAPECDHCGGLLKPATVSFGQSMPEREMGLAVRACHDCDVFLAVGSSLVVYPAAALPELAKQNGATLVIVNRTPTPMDGIADLVINDEIGKTLPQLIGMTIH